eukprot:jgi/Botrbrau1/11222/Bobra.0075s0018.1
MASKIQSGVSAVPVTVSRPVPGDDLSKVIENPGAPRASVAISKENPEGKTGSEQLWRTRPEKTVLQQHVDLWTDENGIIWPTATYVGFRKVGFNPILSFIAIFVIHGTFSFASQDGWLPDLRMPIYVKNIHRTKHGSDSEVYDTEGRFVPQKFEELFSKYDTGNKGYLTLKETWHLTQANRNVMDPVGWTAEKLEFLSFYYVAHKVSDDGKVGFVTKEQVRAQYDGSLFHEMARKNNLQDSDLALEVSVLKLVTAGVVGVVTCLVATALYAALEPATLKK